MRLLLDTHVWFWALESPEKLGHACRAVLEDTQNQLAIATVSTLELGQLMIVGKIDLKGTLDAWVRRGLQSIGAQTVEMSHAIALRAYTLPGEFHKDPADRILVATAIDHGLTLATADERILAYPHVMALDARQ
jgi:PIN domain nuclease of toxin-antitoxin system